MSGYRVDLDQLFGDPLGVDLVFTPGQGVPGGPHPAAIDIRRRGHGIRDPLQIRRHDVRDDDMIGILVDMRLFRFPMVDGRPAIVVERPGRCRDVPREIRRLSAGFARISSGPILRDIEALPPRGVLWPTCGHINGGSS